ncbi:MAG: glycerophosphodiester phosphodiesterase family protein, partial [Hyphomicrobiales bacterium]
MFDAASLFKNPIAHRGLHDKSQDRVENCESSFQAAIDAGFAIECDVRMSEDNQVVVFHDDTLGRLTQNASTVRDLSVAELKKVPFNDGPDRIQTLNELLEQVSEKVPLIIELKSQWDGDLGLALRVAETIGTYFGPVATMSFDPALVKEAQRWLPHVPNGIVAEHYQDTEEWRFLSR